MQRAPPDACEHHQEGQDGRMAEIAAIYCHTGGRLSSSSCEGGCGGCAALHVGFLSVRG